MDPAFEAHASPALHWSMALWPKWFPRDQLQMAFTDASLRLAARTGSPGNGPASALVASLERLGWIMPSFTEAVDDLGTSWRFDLDSPGAIATACRDSVRRWRIRRVGIAVPGLIPEACDVGAPDSETGTMRRYSAMRA